MTVCVTGLVAECWSNTMLGGNRLSPLRDVPFLLYRHVCDTYCHPAVEISPPDPLSPHTVAYEIVILDTVMYSFAGWPWELGEKTFRKTVLVYHDGTERCALILLYISYVMALYGIPRGLLALEHCFTAQLGKVCVYWFYKAAVGEQKRPSAFIIGCLIISVRADFGVGNLAMVIGVFVRRILEKPWKKCEFNKGWKGCSVLF